MENKDHKLPMKLNHSTITKKIAIIILLALLVMPVFGQTEEQQKHPKFSEMMEHYNAYNTAS
jgi:outer membrane lipoprotein-sorting protein